MVKKIGALENIVSWMVAPSYPCSRASLPSLVVHHVPILKNYL